MKNFCLVWICFLLMGCGTRVEFLFLNRLVVFDEGLSQMVEREFLPVVVLRYRWLDNSRALVYGMDEEHNRQWWLWESGKKRFFSLDEEVQGFDVSGEKVLAIGKEWNQGFPLWVGSIRGKSFYSDFSFRFPFVPENSIGVEGGFYLAGKEETGIHRVFFLSFNGKLEEKLILTNTLATLRFGRLKGKIVVYTTYEKEGGESLFAILNEDKIEWKVLTHEGTAVQKAVFLDEVMGLPVAHKGEVFWLVIDETMKVIGRGPKWNAVVFEELFDQKGSEKGVFLCLLPSEKRSVLMVFRWDGKRWTWKSFFP